MPPDAGGVSSADTRQNTQPVAARILTDSVPDPMHHQKETSALPYKPTAPARSLVLPLRTAERKSHLLVFYPSTPKQNFIRSVTL